MTKKLRIAMIGCGGISVGAHISNYKDMDNVEIVWLCDILPEKMAAAKAKYAFISAAKETTDYNEVLADPEVDAVDICTPNYLHSIIAIAALNAGKHVMTEKPDAMTEAEVVEMKKAAEANGKVLMAMRNNRFMPCSTYTKNAIARGDFGEVYAGRCGWVRRRGVPGRGSWFTDKKQSGGGPLIDLGVHMIDLSMYLMGNPKPVSVTGSTYSKFSHLGGGEGVFDVEDLAMGFIKFDNGACLQFEFSWASNIEYEHRFVELRGTKAGCKILGDALTIYSEKDGGQSNEDLHFRGLYGHTAALIHFVDVVLNGAKPIFEPQQGVDMIKLLNAIYESAETGKEIRL